MLLTSIVLRYVLMLSSIFDNPLVLLDKLNYIPSTGFLGAKALNGSLGPRTRVPNDRTQMLGPKYRDPNSRV